MNNKEELDPNWHCVEFQRKRREELSDLYNNDRKKYDELLERARKEFGFPEREEKSK